MTDARPLTSPEADRTAPRSLLLGWFAFVLSVVSTIAYFVASQGIRNFAILVVEGLAKLTKITGGGG